MRQNKKVFFILLVSFFTTHFGYSQKPVERTKVTKNISMEVPTELRPMSISELYSKYVSAKAPLAMYTSEDQMIDLGINETSTKWGNDLEILKSFYKASILNLFDEVNFYQEDIKEIGGRKFIVFEFVSSVSEENTTIGGVSTISKYTYIQYTLEDENILLFNFNCPAKLRAQWQETAKQVMNSVKIK